MNLVPITLAQARRFIGEHHRHNIPPRGWKFGVGLEDDCGLLIGVAVASRPVARMLDDGTTLEVTRTCTLGNRNANSMLYGALGRAAKALGYQRIITYTLPSESGISLRAAGFSCEETVNPGSSWSRPSRPEYQTDIFGEERRPPGEKLRWARTL